VNETNVSLVVLLFVPDTAVREVHGVEPVSQIVLQVGDSNPVFDPLRRGPKEAGLIPQGTNLRDQGVGGSNPLSPTNIFMHIMQFSGFRLHRGRRFRNGDVL
jgi:hypothetical protein